MFSQLPPVPARVQVPEDDAFAAMTEWPACDKPLDLENNNNLEAGSLEAGLPPRRMDFSDLVAEQKAHGKDTSAFAAAGEWRSMNADQLVAMASNLAEVHEDIIGNMDATTKIGMLPFAWCDTSLTWKDVSFKVKDTAGAWRTILKDCSGHLPSGSLLALMGPSGCGKSTLLDILAQKKTTPYEGNVFCNGNNVKGDTYFKRYSTYVPQSDDMHEVLTVKETIFFNVFLKNPPPYKFAKLHPEMAGKMPNVFLSALGLTPVQNTIIGGDKSGLRGVSGGQKRRVTLARGAISGAQLLFADEPTSGLSATDAETCIKALRFLCKRIGLTCLVVIHQPRVEVAELFDHLVLLTAYPDKYGGSVVYNGPMNGTVDFVARVGYPVPDRANPADWLMDMVSPGYKHVLVKQGVKKLDESVVDFVNYYKQKTVPSVQAIVEKAVANQGQAPIELVQMRWARVAEFMKPTDAKLLPTPRKSVYGTSFGMQMALLLATKLKILKRDKKGLRMRMGMSIMQGIIVGLAFQDISSKDELQHVQFHFMVMQMAAMAGMQVMPGLVDLRTVMKKDNDEGLHSITAWIAGNCFIDAFVTFFTCSIFSVIVFAFGCFDFGDFPVFYFWVILVVMTMDSYFNLIAAVAPTGQLSMVMAMPFMIMFILFNGFLVSKSSAPSFMVWALFVSPFFYGITSLSNALYGEGKCSVERKTSCALVITTYKFDEGPSDHTSIIVLLSLFFMFRVLQMVALQKLNKAEK